MHIPRCGPLTDTAVVFGQEDLLAKSLNFPRRGALNFVVGVNGSGKSSLLRALYQIFRELKSREWPSLPVTLAWDRATGVEKVTALLHFPNAREAAPFFAVIKQVSASATRSDWESITVALESETEHFMVQRKEYVKGPDAVKNSILDAHLPKRLIAYTSGTDDPWLRLEQSVLHMADESVEDYDNEDERTQGWSMEREWERQAMRLSEVVTRNAANRGGGPSAPGTGQVADSSREVLSRLTQELDPLRRIQDKLSQSRRARSEQLDSPQFRVYSHELRLAGITLGLWQAAKDLASLPDEGQRTAWRSALVQQGASNIKATDARRVLSEIDWLWPTHLSIIYCDPDDQISPRQSEELLCLVTLADEVIAQPHGRKRAVISLGPSDRISLSEKLKEVLPLGIPSKGLEFIAERVDGSKTGAEAVLRILSADKDLDSTPMDGFSRLRDWKRAGLLEDITFTIKRLHRSRSIYGEEDDTLVTYEQLSDGEQMLLCRMGLLFLLRGQDGSLLLFDEPETHFNDVWKREIVEMIDLALLNSTDANVIVATHTSIALTDAFAAEVTVLDKTAGQTSARGVGGGLFGTDPGEVAMNLFRADSNIGSRSLDFLDQLLKTEAN